MRGIVLDAGALIALERDDRRMWAALKLAAARTQDVVVPSAVLAQVWRAGRTQAMLARALEHCVLASFDDVARRVGELCGRTKTNDLVDAQVAIIAVERADVLYTSDPGELKRLIAALGQRAPVIVRC